MTTSGAPDPHCRCRGSDFSRTFRSSLRAASSPLDIGGTTLRNLIGFRIFRPWRLSVNS